MKIDIVSDTVCPWCYVGKRRLERALAIRPDIKAEITWRPFQLNPDMAPEGEDREAHLAAKFGGGDRIRKAQETLIELGRQEGIDFQFRRATRIPNTLASHALLRWALEAGCQNDVANRLFDRYFTQGADIGSAAVLADVAAEAGMDRTEIAARLARRQDFDVVAEEDASYRRMGINGVPCFIIDRRYALSGAQDPAVFHQVFDKVLQEAA